MNAYANRFGRATVLAAAACFLGGATAPATAPKPITGLGAIAFVDTQHGWAGGRGGILATTDGGKTWRTQLSGHVNITTLDFIDANTGWAAGIDIVPGTGILLSTTDGGKHWARLSEPSRPLRSVSFANASIGFGPAGGTPLSQTTVTEATQPYDSARLAATRDGGRTWSLLDEPLGVASACASSASSAWAGYEATVLHSDDAGDSWVRALSAEIDTRLEWYASVRCTRSGASWVLFGNNRVERGGRPYIVFHSGDGGTTWEAVLENTATPDAYPLMRAPDGPASFPGSLSAIDASTAYLLGICQTCAGGRGEATITATTDGGKTWRTATPVTGLHFEGPIAMTFADAKTGWVVGTTGGRGVILKTFDGGVTWTKQYPR